MSDSNLDTVTQEHPHPVDKQFNLTGNQEESSGPSEGSDPVGRLALQGRQEGFGEHEGS